MTDEEINNYKEVCPTKPDELEISIKIQNAIHNRSGANKALIEIGKKYGPKERN